MMVFEKFNNMQASILLIIFILASTPTLLLSSQNFPLAKLNCSDHCGDISIPFPFGTTEECSMSSNFRVTCNHTAIDPPKLFWEDSSIEITNISTHGQIKLLQSVAYDCYYSNGSRALNFSTWIELPTYFTVNNTANKFTIVGCNALAFVSGISRLGRSFKTGCTAMCSSEADLTEGECAGMGCCQTPIPRDLWRVEVEADSYSNYTDVWDFNNCSYAFVAEQTAFNFSKENLKNLYSIDTLPMVVDWVVGNQTCEELAGTNTTGYACVSANSICDNPQNGYGYRCRCNDGFEGNPYLHHGCIDIDECKTQNNCSKYASCINTQGNYTCSCPEEYNGDGIGDDGCKEKVDPKKQDMKTPYVVIGVASGVIALLLAIIFIHLELKRRSQNKTKRKLFLQNGGPMLQEKLARREASPEMVTIFSSSELEKATNNFHNSMIIGQGGFGTVYKGVLADRRTVAIKRSIRVDPTQIEQFINEVFILSQINHRNVVKLLGCCLETDVPHLVYEFITNGTLSSHLHNEAKARALDWNTRLKIAAETAGVLSYLHSSAATPIIHRDVKTDNILLDHTFTAKVADFGASKLVPIDLAQLSTMVQGTFGYLDPEYMQTNQLTEKSDVYSFGVVLLELVTGRRALSFDRPVEEKSLANYFLSVLKQDLLFEIVDDKIVGSANMEQISAVAKLAKECLNVRGEDRPSMKEVAMELEGLILRGKHSWARINVENEEEKEFLLPNDDGMSHFGNGDSSSSVGYDSISRDHILLPMNGGR
ncbi:putative wall-associated receptor kinase-like 16 [Salvia miltiorrhiza]|uniref:putative wall-associated receptor kinase-like 16 n=1 Tax=Salvia miltiorrhiza TaxID=226208 RepID=UPI0025AD579F|nr:putative wall-associated receptor kinase-like 16 [Salvia miltiorrhiza]